MEFFFDNFSTGLLKICLKSSFPSISQLVEPFRSNAFDSSTNILTAEEEDELLYGDNIELNTIDSVFTDAEKEQNKSERKASKF